MGEETASNPGDMPKEQSAMPAVQESTEGHYRVLSNGSLMDPVTGLIVKGQALTSEQARELAALREVRAAEAIAEAVAEGDETALDPARRSVFGGWKTVGKAQMLLALSPERGRASTEAAKWLGHAAKLAPEAGGSNSAPAVRLELSAGALEYIGELMRRRAQGE